MWIAGRGISRDCGCADFAESDWESWQRAAPLRRPKAMLRNGRNKRGMPLRLHRSIVPTRSHSDKFPECDLCPGSLPRAEQEWLRATYEMDSWSATDRDFS